MGADTFTITRIPIWDRIKIHVSSLLLGVWVLCRRMLKKFWDSKSLSCKPRDDPPPCLVDSSLGTHKHKIIKGIKFHYLEAGSRDQSVVLLLHGFLDCWLTWRYQIPVLAEHFHVVALDLKGFGDSEKPMWRNSYRAAEILEELKLFIQSLGVTSCTVVGHDLGGILGWYLVHQYPEFVDRFIAVSSPHPNLMWRTLPPHSLFNSQWISFAQLPFLPEIDAMKNDLKIVNSYHKHLQAKENGAYLEAYKYSFSRLQDWAGPINYFRNFPFLRVNENSQEVKVKTMLVTGKTDQSVDLEAVVQSTDYCEKFVLKIVDGAGHFPHQENPEMFNREMLKFLKVGLTRKLIERAPSRGLIDRMFGAVSTTVRYGNSILDSTQKKSVSSFRFSLSEDSS